MLPENEVRAKIGQEFSAQAGNYDVASMSNYEVPTYAKNGWLTSMDEGVVDAEGFNQGDILAPMAESMTFEDQIYGEPFLRRGLLPDVPEGHLRKGRCDGCRTIPPGMKWPIWRRRSTVLRREPRASAWRGLPGWGEMFAPLTTVVISSGETWFDENWEAQVDSKEFKEAANFYVDLIKDRGESEHRRPDTQMPNQPAAGQCCDVVQLDGGDGTFEADDPLVKDKSGVSQPR